MNVSYVDGEMWICKPAGMNQGKGIFLVRTREELIEKLQCKTVNNSRQRFLPTAGRVIQRWLLLSFVKFHNGLLLHIEKMHP